MRNIMISLMAMLMMLMASGCTSENLNLSVSRSHCLEHTGNTQPIKLHLAGQSERLTVIKESDFDAIEVSSGIRLEVSDEVAAITVETDEIVAPFVAVTFKDNVLCIGYSDNLNMDADPHTRLILPNIDGVKSVSASGASSFICQPTITMPHFVLNISGASQATCSYNNSASSIEVIMSGNSELTMSATASQIVGDISGNSSVELTNNNNEATMDIALSGASSLHMTGHAKAYRANISGSSQMESHQLNTEEVEVILSGASMARLHCSKSLDANLSGASQLYYTGNPSEHCNIEATGGSVYEQF